MKDICITSRVRLARNLQNRHFPLTMSENEAHQIKNEIVGAAKSYTLYEVTEENIIICQTLLEKHLISPQMLKVGNATRACLINNDQTVSIMVNEEDHLRIQALLPGNSLDKCFALADQAEDHLALDIAFHEKYGYLTSCPTNTGTGMRASIMMHLPALSLTGTINSLLNTAGKIGITIRGTYGEGTEALGFFYQVSNQVTLGISETEIIEKLSQIAIKILANEVDMREKLMQSNPVKMKDKILRAYGLLCSSYSMPSQEFMKLQSDVRLGIAMGVITDMTLEQLDKLMLSVQPGHLLMKYGNISAEQRDILRAEILRTTNHS